MDSSLTNYIDRLFYNSYFYFSNDGKYDITRTLQKQNELDSKEAFVWNASMLLDETITNPFFTKVIQGFVSIVKLPENAEFAVISRRSKFRAGTRYNKRYFYNKNLEELMKKVMLLILLKRSKF